MFLYADYSGSSDGFYWVRFVQTEKGDRARDIAFYEAGSTYDPSFDATSDTEVFLGWYTESGELLTDLDGHGEPQPSTRSGKAIFMIDV